MSLTPPLYRGRHPADTRSVLRKTVAAGAWPKAHVLASRLNVSSRAKPEATDRQLELPLSAESGPLRDHLLASAADRRRVRTSLQHFYEEPSMVFG